jgi:hypothetical protein
MRDPEELRLRLSTMLRAAKEASASMDVNLAEKAAKPSVESNCDWYLSVLCLPDSTVEGPMSFENLKDALQTLTSDGAIVDLVWKGSSPHLYEIFFGDSLDRLIDRSSPPTLDEQFSTDSNSRRRQFVEHVLHDPDDVNELLKWFSQSSPRTLPQPEADGTTDVTDYCIEQFLEQTNGPDLPPDTDADVARDLIRCAVELCRSAETVSAARNLEGELGSGEAAKQFLRRRKIVGMLMSIARELWPSVCDVYDRNPARSMNQFLVEVLTAPHDCGWKLQSRIGVLSECLNCDFVAIPPHQR